MKSFVRAALTLVLMLHAGAASAMSQSQIPTKIGIPFGNGAGAPYIRTIPQASQIGIQNCAASWTDGFPPLTFVPASAGGCPPFGQDFNGVLNAISTWSRWMQANAGLPWDSAFSSAIGGYPKGALVQSNVLIGRIWYSTADNNVTNPDATTGASGWTVLPGTYAAGAPIAVFASSSAPPNAVPANGLTIGNASSNATNRANADTFWLFSFQWSNCATCTLFNSSGGVVARGANAAADFAANTAIQTVNMNGTALIGADSIAGTSTTFLTGVPVQSGSSTVPSSILGENLHRLVGSELPTTTPTFTGSPTTPTFTGVAVSPTFSGFADTVNVSSTQSTIAVGATPTTTPGGNFNINSVNALGITINSSGTFTPRGVVSTITPAGTISAVTPSGTISSFGSNGSHNTVDRSAIVYWYQAL